MKLIIVSELKAREPNPRKLVVDMDFPTRAPAFSITLSLSATTLSKQPSESCVPPLVQFFLTLTARFTEYADDDSVIPSFPILLCSVFAIMRI